MDLGGADALKIYKDTSSGLYYYVDANGNWQEFTTGGSGNTIYSGDGTISEDRTVDGDNTAALFFQNLKDFQLNSNEKVRLIGTTEAALRATNGNVYIDSNGGNVIVNGIKVYKALISQSGTDAPTAVVLENSLGGGVIWSRSNVGYYEGTLSGVFSADKTTIFTGQWYVSGVGQITYAYRDSDNAVVIETSEFSGGSFVNIDDGLESVLVTIEVYP